MKYIMLAMPLFMLGCASNCETVRLSLNDAENGEYRLIICKKLIGDESTILPARGSAKYKHYESNVDDFLRNSKYLNSCVSRKESLMFYESGNVVTINIKCKNILKLAEKQNRIGNFYVITP